MRHFFKSGERSIDESSAIYLSDFDPNTYSRGGNAANLPQTPSTPLMSINNDFTTSNNAPMNHRGVVTPPPPPQHWGASAPHPTPATATKNHYHATYTNSLANTHGKQVHSIFL
jgi:hypothetical protein